MSAATVGKCLQLLRLKVRATLLVGVHGSNMIGHEMSCAPTIPAGPYWEHPPSFPPWDSLIVEPSV